MGSPWPQDPYGNQQQPQGPPPQPGQPQYGGGSSQPGQPPYAGQAPYGGQPGQPYPGYGDVHGDYYRRQEQQAAEDAAAQQGSYNPLHNLRNWGMPEARPGLNPQEQAFYDSARKKSRGMILQFVGLMAIFAIIGILALVRNFG
jgi:hypothetical protein